MLVNGREPSLLKGRGRPQAEVQKQVDMLLARNATQVALELVGECPNAGEMLLGPIERRFEPPKSNC